MPLAFRDHSIRTAIQESLGALSIVMSSGHEQTNSIERGHGYNYGATRTLKQSHHLLRDDQSSSFRGGTDRPVRSIEAGLKCSTASELVHGEQSTPVDPLSQQFCRAREIFFEMSALFILRGI